MVVGTVQAGIMRALELGEWNAIRKLTLALSELILKALGLKSNEAKAIAGKIVARVFDRKIQSIELGIVPLLTCPCQNSV